MNMPAAIETNENTRTVDPMAKARAARSHKKEPKVMQMEEQSTVNTGQQTTQRKKRLPKPHYFKNKDLLFVFSTILNLEEESKGINYSVSSIPVLLDGIPKYSPPTEGVVVSEVQQQDESDYITSRDEVLKIVYPRAAHAITVKRDYKTIEMIASALATVLPEVTVNMWRRHWIGHVTNGTLPVDVHDLTASFSRVDLSKTGMLFQTDTRPAEERHDAAMREAVSKLAQAWNVKQR